MLVNGHDMWIERTTRKQIPYLHERLLPEQRRKNPFSDGFAGISNCFCLLLSLLGRTEGRISPQLPAQRPKRTTELNQYGTAVPMPLLSQEQIKNKAGFILKPEFKCLLYYDTENPTSYFQEFYHEK